MKGDTMAAIMTQRPTQHQLDTLKRKGAVGILAEMVARLHNKKEVWVCGVFDHDGGGCGYPRHDEGFNTEAEAVAAAREWCGENYPAHVVLA